MTEMSWIVAVTKPRQEMYAKHNVERQGYGAYLPQISETVIVRGTPRTKITPLFPSYLFVRTPGNWSFLESTYGVRSVVLNHAGAATISQDEIDKIKATEVDRYVQLPKPKPQELSYNIGQRVRITDGGLINQLGTYNGMSGTQRVKVLLDFLGRKVVTTLPRHAIEDAALKGVR